MYNKKIFTIKKCPVFHWLSRVEKEEQDGVLLAAYGGKDPATGPMAKIKPHTNSDGSRVIGVDICFVDRSNHKNDFDVYVGAETFWPMAKDIEERVFFNVIAKENAEKKGNYAMPGLYNFKAGKKDEDGHGGGTLQAGFCASTTDGYICLHGYNAQTKANFNIPCSRGSIQLLGALFLQLFDIGESANRRKLAQVENRKKWAENHPEDQTQSSESSETEAQSSVLVIEGTVCRTANTPDKDGMYYFLAETQGNPIIVKMKEYKPVREGQPFKISGSYTGEKVQAAGSACAVFIMTA